MKVKVYAKQAQHKRVSAPQVLVQREEDEEGLAEVVRKAGVVARAKYAESMIEHRRKIQMAIAERSGSRPLIKAAP